MFSPTRQVFRSAVSFPSSYSCLVSKHEHHHANQLYLQQLRTLLLIRPSDEVIFERYSDSAGNYVVLDSTNSQVYKTLFRAAKAKLKLRLRATLVTKNEESSTATTSAAPLEPIRSTFRATQTLIQPPATVAPPPVAQSPDAPAVPPKYVPFARPAPLRKEGFREEIRDAGEKQDQAFKSAPVDDERKYSLTSYSVDGC